MTKKTTIIDGKLYKTCTVVMLPTKRSRIHKKDDGMYMTAEDNGFVPYSYAQHLYILSNEQIKEGDIQYFNGKISRASEEIGIHPDTKKVIASTDSSLTTGPYNEQLGRNTYVLPRPSNAFIEAYVKAQGKIEKVLVELNGHSDYKGKDTPEGIYFGSIKLAPDNTVTIKAVKEKTPVEQILDYMADGNYNYTNPVLYSFVASFIAK